MCDNSSTSLTMSSNVRSSHSRESSVSVASSDSNVSNNGLVLSVSALSKRGPGTCKDTCSVDTKDSPRSEDDSGVAGSDSISVTSDQDSQCETVTRTMGQAHGHSDTGDTEDNIDTMVRLEPEGLNEEDNQSYTSYLSVDKRLFGRLQKELTQAHSDLKEKEEEVKKLSRIRDDVEREMEDLTASLFQVKLNITLIASGTSNKIISWSQQC